MDIGEYTRNILIEKQKDGNYAVMLQSNTIDTGTYGTSYILLGRTTGAKVIMADGRECLILV